MTASGKLRAAFRYLWERIVRYALKFGVVGLIGYAIDTGIFNLLRLGAFGSDHFFQGALGAKLVSTSIAIVFNWIGNRYWTFREHRRRNWVREFAEYVIVSLGGMGISLLCLGVSHYLLGMTSLLADNISANVIGLGLGTLFRFVLYRYWVYGHHRSDGIHAASEIETAELALFIEPETTEKTSAEERA